MEELKRIILDKRFLTVLILVFVLNGALAYNDMKPDSEGERQYVSIYGEEYEEAFDKIESEILESFSGMSDDEIIAELSDIDNQHNQMEQEYHNKLIEEWDGTTEFPDMNAYVMSLDIEERMYYATIGSLLSEYSYIAQYRQSIQDILDRADEQEKNADVFKKGTFAGRNIEKTREDFARLMEIEPEVGAQNSFHMISEYNLSDFIMILVVLAAVLIILDERKKGLWEFTYSMPYGRIRLAVKRVVSMVIVAAFAAILLFFQNLIIAGVIGGGYGDLSRPIQSIFSCSQVILKVNVWQYLGLMLLWKFMVLLMIGLVFLGLVLIFRGYLKVFVLGALMLVGEYIAYTNIEIHSRYAAVKYVNVFTWMDAEWCMSNYNNLNILGYPVHLYNMMCVMVPVLVCLSVGLVIFSGRLKPSAISSRKLFDLAVIVKPYRHGKLFLTELYKQLVVQKLLLVIVLAIAAGVMFYDDSKVYFDYEGTLYKEYMSMLGGEVNEEKLDYLQDEYRVWEKRYKQEKELLGDEELSLQEMEDVKERMEQYETSMQCVEKLQAELMRLLALKEENTNVRFVSVTAYESLIGEEATERKSRDALIVITLGTLAAAVLFSSEHMANAEKLIKSTKRGRWQFQVGKYMVLMVEVLAILVPVILSQLLTADSMYGMTYLSASIKSLNFVEEFPFDISIGMAIAVEYLIMFFMLYVVLLLTAVIFGKIKNVMGAVLSAMAVVVMPAALYYIGFSQMSLFTILNELVVSSWMF